MTKSDFVNEIWAAHDSRGGLTCINLSDKKYFDNRYLMYINYQRFYVIANDIQDALGYLADYCIAKGFDGFFGDEYAEAYFDEEHDDHAYAQDFYTPAGNNSRLFVLPSVITEYKNNERRKQYA